MTGSNGEQPRFHVSAIGPASEAYRDIQRRAELAGGSDRVEAVFREIVRRLKYDPREFGEPMYELRVMHMQVRKAAIDPLYVEYGVHNEQPVVVIRRVRWIGDLAS